MGTSVASVASKEFRAKIREPGAFHAFPHFILIITYEVGSRYFYPHLLNEVIETERDGVACQGHTAEPTFGLVCWTQSQFSFLFTFGGQI